MKSIILASASPRRKELLRQINIAFEIIPSKGEEIISSSIPKEVVQQLAKQKAEDVVKSLNEEKRLVLGADTVVACENQILGKPSDKKQAIQMIGCLQGKAHQVYTGVCLSRLEEDGRIFSKTFYEKTEVWVAPMTEKEILDYIEGRYEAQPGEKLEWEDKAGAYGIQGCFAAFITGIQGDYNNVVGLPIARIYQELKLLNII